MRKKISDLSLLLGSFFLPFGYDALFKKIMEWTGSYWRADIIFYIISFIFFGIYFIANRTNPVKSLLNTICRLFRALCPHKDPQ